MSKEFDDLMDELKKARDEIQLQIHLASMDLKDEWTVLDGKWQDFSARARLDESGDRIGSAFSGLAGEFKEAFDRIRKAIGD